MQAEDFTFISPFNPYYKPVVKYNRNLKGCSTDRDGHSALRKMEQATKDGVTRELWGQAPTLRSLLGHPSAPDWNILPLQPGFHLVTWFVESLRYPP